MDKNVFPVSNNLTTYVVLHRLSSCYFTKNDSYVMCENGKVDIFLGGTLCS